MWIDLLKVSDISVNDDFFALGGNSLLLIKLHSLINQKYKNIIQMQDLFDYRSVRKLSEVILKRNSLQEINSKIENIIF